jgi:hypothetical protein
MAADKPVHGAGSWRGFAQRLYSVGLLSLSGLSQLARGLVAGLRELLSRRAYSPSVISSTLTLLIFADLVQIGGGRAPRDRGLRLPGAVNSR